MIKIGATESRVIGGKGEVKSGSFVPTILLARQWEIK
jgi:hypothetical protein